MPGKDAPGKDAELRARSLALREELERERQLFIAENVELQKQERLKALREADEAEGEATAKEKKGAWAAFCAKEWQLILLGLFCLFVVLFANLGGKAPPPSPEVGETFLSHNAKSTDVRVRSSGLQYKVLKEGYGRRPKRTSKVKVQYEGRLIDGTVFDSSDERGPTSFRLDAVVKGWTEGVPLMREGAHYEFFLPSKLGYGNKARGRWIYPNAVLIFKIKLLECETDCV